MSEEEKGDSVAPDESSSATTQEMSTAQPVGDGENSVKYDTYKRTLSEAKKYKGMVEEMQSKLTEFEQAQLTNEGKKDELIDSLKKQVNEWKGKATSAVSSFAKSKVQETMMSEAARLGCADPELVIKAYGADIDSIDFDDSFNPDRDQIRMTLENIKKERPFLFSKPAPQVGSHQIKPDGVSEPKPKTLSSVKDEELMELWARADSRK